MALNDNILYVAYFIENNHCFICYLFCHENNRQDVKFPRLRFDVEKLLDNWVMQEYSLGKIMS